MINANQIKNKLLELEGGVFQRLCDDWLHRQGYSNINSIGMMTTTNRVTKGTPDSLLIQPDGKYIFTEYTVQQTGLAKKLEDDINKCFDESKTGINIEQISEIIICCLGILTTHEINHLTSLCQKRNVRLSLNGLDSISLSIQNCYPVLSEQYLGLSLDTGQLLSVDDFISRYGKNNFTTPIANKILFHSDTIDKGMNLLNDSQFLLVSGAAGVGKTLFSVNLARAMQENNPTLKVYCLFYKGADLIRDITAHFSEPGDYLIFVDDANRLDSRLDYILHYLNDNDDNRTYRIVATVRDYARDSVITQASEFTDVQEQTIQPLTDEQVKDLVVQLFNIINGNYQQRIQEISGGNARLVMMASRIAVETNQIESIQNVASLYDDYFGQNENIKEVVEDEKLMTAACAISLFRTIDKLNESQMERLQNSFSLSSEAFWGYVEVLHKKELVDLYENEVVKISDQVLSTYLFYLSVFDKKTLSLAMIVKDFFPELKKNIFDTLNPVISAFDQKKIVSEIESQIKPIYKEISNSGDSHRSIRFLNSFWFALPTEALTFANSLISDMPNIDESWENEVFEAAKTEVDEYSLVSLLSSFRTHYVPNFEISFELLLKYLSKNKESLSVVIKTFTNRYNFQPDDFRYGFYVQAHIIDTLIDRSENGNSHLFSRLFMVLAKLFLQVEHTETRWDSGNTITTITFRLSPNEHLTPIRQKILKNLATLMQLPSYEQLALEVFQELISNLRYNGKEMAEADLPYITDYFIPLLIPDNTSHCLIMQDLCEHLDTLEIAYPSKWQDEFNNSTIKLSDLLLEDRHERLILDMGSEEYNQYRHQCFVDYFSGITGEQFSQFMNQCVSLHNAISSRGQGPSLTDGIAMCLKAIAENHPEQIKEIVSTYIDYDNTFNVNPSRLMPTLFNALTSAEVWELINAKTYRRKKMWRSSYFASLPEESINKNQVKSFLQHLNETPSNELPHWLDFLTKYCTVDNDIYAKVVKLLVEKSKTDKNYATPLHYLFAQDLESFDKWFNIFKSDTQLMFDAYLAIYKLERYWDDEGKALDILTQKDTSFINIMVDCIYENESYPHQHTNMPSFDFLWERKNFVDALEQYSKCVFLKEKNYCGLTSNIFSTLFLKEKRKTKGRELTYKQQEFLKHSIINNVNNVKYTCFIFSAANNMSEDFKGELLKLFFIHNKNLEDFQKVENVLTATVWSGSKIPILEREKNLLISLLPSLNSIDLLEHKAYVEEQIEKKIKSIDAEKKWDYLEGWQLNL